MVLPAFGLGLPGREGRFVACQLVPDVRSYLLTALRSFAPATFVVRRSDLEKVAAMPEVRDEPFVDCGEKTDARVEPHRLVRRWSNKVVIMRVQYSSPGRALSSVTSLQTRLSSERRTTVQLLGIPDAVFDRIPEKIGRHDATPPVRSPVVPTHVAEPDDTRVSPPLPRESPLAIPTSIMRRYRGVSRAVRRIREDIVRYATTDEPLLIEGEHGTGKKVIAGLIHAHGSRSDEPFQVLDCSRTLPGLVEAELFGGAGDEGLFQLTAGGTLVIAEIHELPLAAQARVLQDLKAYGGKLGVRVIGTSSADLDTLAEMGRVLPELSAVLKSNTICTPSLRERPEDVPVLAEFYWEELTKGRAKPLPREVLEFLKTQQRWPGNVDDLKEVLKILFARHDDVTLRDLREAVAEYIVRHGYRSLKPAQSQSTVPSADAPLAHLTETIEVLRQCWIALRKVRNGVPLDRASQRAVLTTTRAHVDALERLCAKPLLFGKPSYRAVLELKDKLRWLGDILATRSASDAHAAWREIEEQYEETEVALFDERVRLKKRQ